jgi:hypothetical protein
LPHGYLTIRWTYPTQPPREQWPTLNVSLVHFDEIRECLPSETGSVTAIERNANRLLRHRHVQRRYRQY